MKSDNKEIKNFTFKSIMQNCVNTDRYMYIEIDISKESPVAGEGCWAGIAPPSVSCPSLGNEC